MMSLRFFRQPEQRGGDEKCETDHHQVVEEILGEAGELEGHAENTRRNRPEDQHGGEPPLLRLQKPEQGLPVKNHDCEQGAGVEDNAQRLAFLPVESE